MRHQFDAAERIGAQARDLCFGMSRPLRRRAQTNRVSARWTAPRHATKPTALYFGTRKPGAALQRQAKAGREPPVQIAPERVDPAASAEVQHLGERNQEGGIEAGLPGGAHHEQRANFERKRPQAVAPERVAVRESDLESVLDAVVEH